LEGKKHLTKCHQVALLQTSHAGAAAAVGNPLGGSIAHGGAAVSLLSSNVVVQFDILHAYSHIHTRKLIFLGNLSDFLYRNYVAL
jgi:hypothetical protein